MTAFHIKLVALVSMAVDHVGLFLFPQFPILRIIGRVSYPLFAWLIANGARHTKNKQAYLLRLFLFALISQIPFVLAFRVTDPTFWKLNIFFTLSLGLAATYLLSRYPNRLISLAVILVASALAQIINADYGATGILYIVASHYFFDSPLRLALSFAAIPFLFYPGTIQHFALASVLFISLYNHHEGPRMKSFFYSFYPLHLLVIYLLLLLLPRFQPVPKSSSSTPVFDSASALADITTLVNFGPRHSGSSGNVSARNFILSQLKSFTPHVSTQPWTHKHLALTNIIARFQPDSSARIIIGTHYDSLKDNPGANNSASGTAILLELTRILAQSPPPVGIDLVFFDGEEGETGIVGPGWVPLGSTYFASRLSDYYPTVPPSAAVIIDMVCDSDLRIYQEITSLRSAPDLAGKFWTTADSSAFIPRPKHAILDDHTPLAASGIPSILLIDFDYPYYGTSADTPDKCSPHSLKAVGSSILNYIWTL